MFWGLFVFVFYYFLDSMFATWQLDSKWISRTFHLVWTENSDALFFLTGILGMFCFVLFWPVLYCRCIHFTSNTVINIVRFTKPLCLGKRGNVVLEQLTVTCSNTVRTNVSVVFAVQWIAWLDCVLVTLLINQLVYNLTLVFDCYRSITRLTGNRTHTCEVPVFIC